MQDLLDKVVLLISRILIYASCGLFSLTSDQMHIPGLANLGFVVGFVRFAKQHRNCYQETCILLLKLLLVCIEYFMLCTCSCLDFPTCTKGSVIVLHCLLFLKRSCFKMNSVGNLFSHLSLLCIKNIQLAAICLMPKYCNILQQIFFQFCELSYLF